MENNAQNAIKYNKRQDNETRMWHIELDENQLVKDKQIFHFPENRSL